MDEQLFSLTEYGRALVAKNIGLAHKMSSQLRRPASFSQDEWQSELYLALCKAIAYYNPNMGAAISTFVCRGMIFHVISLHRAITRRHKRAAFVQVAPDGRCLAGIPERSPHNESAEDREFSERVHAALTAVPGWELVKGRYLDGQNLEQLGAERGYTRERARQVVERAARQLRTCVRFQHLASLLAK